MVKLTADHPIAVRGHGWRIERQFAAPLFIKQFLYEAVGGIDDILPQHLHFPSRINAPE